MAQRIQAPLNADLCLIISREGLSMLPQKRETGRERQQNEREGKRLKARKRRV